MGVPVAWYCKHCLLSLMGQCLCVAQEAIEKGWLREERTLTSADGAPNLATILAVAREIASGMAFLHERGVVHGDLTGGVHFPASYVLLYLPMSFTVSCVFLFYRDLRAHREGNLFEQPQCALSRASGKGVCRGSN